MTIIEPPSGELRIDALVRITQAIETAATLEDLSQLALRELARLFDAMCGCVLLLNENNGAEYIVHTYPAQSPLPDARALSMAPAVRRAMRKRQIVRAADRDREGSRSSLHEMLHAHGARQALVAPLIAQDRPIGVLALGVSDETRRFTPDDSALLRMLTGQFAAASSALRLNEAASRRNEEAQRRNEELNTINDIATTVTSTLDTHQVYWLVVQKLREYFKVEAGSLLLRDEVTGDLHFVMTIEAGEEKLAGVRVPVGQGVVGHVAQTHQWAIIEDAQNDPRFYRKVSEDVGFVTRSILCVPMIAAGRVVGVIELLNKLDGHFTEDEAERLMRMAAFIGVAIENAHLFQQVMNAHDRLKAILNSTADGILMTDMHGVVLTANPMAARLFDSSEADLVGQRLDELLNDLHSRAHSVVHRSWGNGRAATTEDAPLYASEIELGGAKRLFVLHLAMPVRGAHEQIYGQLAVFRDITQEKELEKLREDYTGMLIHDLRAPLTAIMNGILMIKRGLGGPVTEQQLELLAIAYHGSQTMLELVNNLLDISKMEQGHLQLNLEPLSPYTILDDAVERLQASARAQNVLLDQRLAVGLPLVEADKDKVVRVLQNLIDNAIKFSPTGQAVMVGACVFRAGGQLIVHEDKALHPPMSDGEWLVFWVRDQGMGIPRAYHERIFEKFGQVHGRKVRGTGLGLTFCKLVVEAHTGRIWVESEEAAGSVFAFALPLATESV